MKMYIQNMSYFLLRQQCKSTIFYCIHYKSNKKCKYFCNMYSKVLLTTMTIIRFNIAALLKVAAITASILGNGIGF